MWDITDLYEGAVTLSYPPDLRAAVEKAVASWKKFCSLPKEIRSRFPYHPGDGMGVGYECKQTPGATLDIKEDFHLTLAARSWLMGQASKCSDPAILQFVTDAESLIDVVRPTVNAFAKATEAACGLEDFGKDVADNSNMWFIRFLHYFEDRNIGDEIASSHLDKSAFTLHLYESHPGLERLTREGKWIDMPVSEGETVIIPGVRLQYRSENRIKATYHRVVATAQTANEGRFSAVCFIHPKHTPVYDKKRAGRLQEFPPGFNYAMSWREFKGLFCPE